MRCAVPPPLTKHEAYVGARVRDRVTGQVGRIEAVAWPRILVYWGADLLLHFSTWQDLTRAEPQE